MNEGNVLLTQAAAPGTLPQTMLGNQTPARKKPHMKLLVITFVVMGVVGYLIYTGVRDTLTYYLTVSELLKQNVPLAQQKVRLGGIVRDGSVQWAPDGGKLSFIIKDEQAAAAVSVVYQGVVPDTFEQGHKVMIEGIYANGVFTASQIMPTCPSKYE